MKRVFFVILTVCLLGFAARPVPVAAQGTDGVPVVRTAGTVANLFESLDPRSPIDGVRLRLPGHWTVRDLRLLRYGTVEVPVQWEARPDGTVVVAAEQSVEGPHELVLRVDLGDRTGTYEWQVTPFVRTERDSVDRRRVRRSESAVRLVNVDAVSRPGGSNRVLDMGEADRPVLLRSSDRLTIGRGSFTVEFWMRTGGLNQVVLSTWTGEETVAYPAEVTVDQSGRLRFYFGRAGRHQAMRTSAPVADDHWHHAAVIYDEAASRLRLMLDGAVVDSLEARRLPAIPGRRTVAIGGRRPETANGGTSPRTYTGRLDEVRFWSTARTASTLRRQRNRPFSSSTTDEDPLRFNFDQQPTAEAVDWPAGIRRVRSSLSFQSPLRNLEAHTSEQSVTLRWEAEVADEETFVVERSTNGDMFTDIARVDPSRPAAPRTGSREVVYTDENVPEQVVYYRIRQLSSNEESERTTGTVKIGLGEVSEEGPAVELIGNFPNPFKEQTTITYRVREARALTLTIWDLSGKRVATLADGMHEAGYYEKAFSVPDLPSGTYFARLNSSRGVQSHRMVLLK